MSRFGPGFRCACTGSSKRGSPGLKWPVNLVSILGVLGRFKACGSTGLRASTSVTPSALCLFLISFTNEPTLSKSSCLPFGWTSGPAWSNLGFCNGPGTSDGWGKSDKAHRWCVGTSGLCARPPADGTTCTRSWPWGSNGLECIKFVPRSWSATEGGGMIKGVLCTGSGRKTLGAPGGVNKSLPGGIKFGRFCTGADWTRLGGTRALPIFRGGTGEGWSTTGSTMAGGRGISIPRSLKISFTLLLGFALSKTAVVAGMSGISTTAPSGGWSLWTWILSTVPPILISAQFTKVSWIPQPIQLLPSSDVP